MIRNGFAFVMLLHGLIHLMRYLKAFGYGNIQLGYLGTIQSVYGLSGTAIVILTLTPAVKDHYVKPRNIYKL